VESGVNKEPIAPPPDPYRAFSTLNNTRNNKEAYNIVPIKRKGEYSKTFISCGTT
jgi:hypothetical protein